MRARRARTDAGFTLIEMLVALALLALAAAMMLQGLGSAQRLWAGETARTARGETIEAAQAILRARIEHLRPTTRFEAQTSLTSAELSFTDIDGDDHRLVFIAPPAEVERPAAARRYRLTLTGQGDLILGSAPAQVDAEASALYNDEVLLRDVGGLDISYYGPDSAGGTPQWRSDWTQRATPPELVKIRLTLNAADRRVWPELIIHPAARVDTLCSIDAATGSCRGRE